MLQAAHLNQILAEAITIELSAAELILDSDASTIKQLLSEGKMTEKFWILAFDKKIQALSLKDETDHA